MLCVWLGLTQRLGVSESEMLCFVCWQLMLQVLRLPGGLGIATDISRTTDFRLFFQISLCSYDFISHVPMLMCECTSRCGWCMWVCITSHARVQLCDNTRGSQYARLLASVGGSCTRAREAQYCLGKSTSEALEQGRDRTVQCSKPVGTDYLRVRILNSVPMLSSI